MDSGADLRLALSEQEAEQRLREAAGERRSFHLRCHESSDGEEIGSLMRLFGQFLYGVLRSSHILDSRKFAAPRRGRGDPKPRPPREISSASVPLGLAHHEPRLPVRDRKSTRLNSSHTVISYAVFCLKK